MNATPRLRHRLLDHRLLDHRLLDHRLLDHRLLDHRRLNHLRRIAADFSKVPDWARSPAPDTASSGWRRSRRHRPIPIAPPKLSSEKWWPSKWGADDQAGASNHITPAKVLDASKWIKDGKIYKLGHDQ